MFKIWYIILLKDKLVIFICLYYLLYKISYNSTLLFHTCYYCTRFFIKTYNRRRWSSLRRISGITIRAVDGMLLWKFGMRKIKSEKSSRLSCHLVDNLPLLISEFQFVLTLLPVLWGKFVCMTFEFFLHH